jgi:capsular polysaccharide biosynthesis protein
MQKEDYREDEINLYDFWLIIKKRWLIIFFITMISIGLAFSYIMLTPKVYKISNILLLNQIQDGDVINQSEVTAAISVFDKLKGNHKDKMLSLLGINENQFRDIISIKTSDIKGTNAFWVDIDAIDRESGVAVMEAMPKYIFSNPNISSKISLQKTLLQKNRDDLKSIIENPMQVFKLYRNPFFYLPSIDLYNLREKYNRINVMLEKMDNGRFVSLAWKTMPPTKPYKPRIRSIAFISLAMGVFLGIIGAILLEWVRNNQDSHRSSFEDG